MARDKEDDKVNKIKTLIEGLGLSFKVFIPGWNEEDPRFFVSFKGKQVACGSGNNLKTNGAEWARFLEGPLRPLGISVESSKRPIYF